MQISASTLLASQQAAQTATKPQPSGPGFSQALEKSAGFQPLSLRQSAPPAGMFTSAVQPTSVSASRPGSALDIKV